MIRVFDQFEYSRPAAVLKLAHEFKVRDAVLVSWKFERGSLVPSPSQQTLD
jgi:hypothetical protein